MNRPLLVIDGDSFAHRSFYGLPKSIRRKSNLGGGAIVGFANFLLRLHAAENPRAVLVGWDTLDVPTYRQTLFPAYQSGRQFDAELVEQLEVLPRFVAACGFANAKAAGYEADDFLAAAAAREERSGGYAIVASGDRDAFQLASDRTTVLHPVRAGDMARIGPVEVRQRYGVDPKQVPDFIACVEIPPTSCREPEVSDQRGPPTCYADTRPLRMLCRTDGSRRRLTRCDATAALHSWIPLRPSLACLTESPPGRWRPPSLRNGI